MINMKIRKANDEGEVKISFDGNLICDKKFLPQVIKELSDEFNQQINDKYLKLYHPIRKEYSFA